MDIEEILTRLREPQLAKLAEEFLESFTAPSPAPRKQRPGLTVTLVGGETENHPPGEYEILDSGALRIGTTVYAPGQWRSIK